MKRKIEIPHGVSLDIVANILIEFKEKGESVYCNYLGHELSSNEITSVDSAYLKVTGYTKEEYCNKIKSEEEQRKEQNKINREKAIENIPKWIEEGKKIIFPERYEEWEKIVISCANGIYYGKEIESALVIMNALENGATMEQAKEIFKKNGEGTAVRNVIFHFSKQGPEFWEATSFKRISFKSRRLLNAKKKENLQLARANIIKNANNNHRHL